MVLYIPLNRSDLARWTLEFPLLCRRPPCPWRLIYGETSRDIWPLPGRRCSRRGRPTKSRASKLQKQRSIERNDRCPDRFRTVAVQLEALALLLQTDAGDEERCQAHSRDRHEWPLTRALSPVG